MSIESVLYTKLSGSSGITSLVGANIYPTLAPESVTAEFITFHKVNQDTDRHLCGITTLRSSTFDFYGWSATALGAVSIGDAVHDALVMAAFGSGPYVKGSRLDSMVSFYENESRLYRVAVTITFYYSV